MGQTWTYLKCFQQERPEGMRKGGEKIKVVAIGYPDVGKTCQYMRLCRDDFGNYPSHNDYEQNDDVIVGGKTLNLRFWNSDAQEGFDNIRPLSYPDHPQRALRLPIGINLSKRKMLIFYLFLLATLHECNFLAILGCP